MKSLSNLSPIARAGAQLFATVAIAFVGAVAMASEATQFEIEPSVKTRAEVKAEMASSPKETAVIQIGEATVFVDKVGATRERSRAEVRAQALQAAHDHSHLQLCVGA
jgi:hypothetical protein